MKIASIHQVQSSKKPNLWTFNLALGGFVINGFLYNADTGSIISPRGSNNRTIVRGFGAQMNTLRTLVQQALENTVDNVNKP